MKSEKINIKTRDGICDSYIAYPDEEKKCPTVLFLMDVFGLRSYLFEMVQELAGHGYYVLAPNLFYRTKKSPLLDVKYPISKDEMPKVFEKLKPIRAEFSPDLFLKDVPDFLEFLSNQKNVKSGKFAVTGYCMGGTLAIRASETYPDRFAAVAAFHAGRLATNEPDSPHLLVSKIKSQVYIGNADHDESMPQEQIDRLQKALDDAETRYEMETYVAAEHGFTMKDLPTYNSEALQRHWKKLLELLKKTL